MPKPLGSCGSRAPSWPAGARAVEGRRRDRYQLGGAGLRAGTAPSRPRRSRARSWHRSRRSGRCRAPSPASSDRATARIASARSPAEVGQPCWSATTLNSSRSAANRSIVRTNCGRASCRPRRCAGSRGGRAPRGPRAAGLAGPVDVDRPDRVVLDVGAPLLAVEHVVRGDVDQGHALRGAGAGEVARPVGVDPEGEVALLLGAVDRRW